MERALKILKLDLTIVEMLLVWLSGTKVDGCGRKREVGGQGLVGKEKSVGMSELVRKWLEAEYSQKLKGRSNEGR